MNGVKALEHGEALSPASLVLFCHVYESLYGQSAEFSFSKISKTLPLMVDAIYPASF